MLSLKHPSHFTCSTIINTCSVYPPSPQKDVTVFHSVSLGWLVTSMSIWSQYQYMFCLCPPPPPPSPYIGAWPPYPKLNRLPACLPIYVYIYIYIPGTLYMIDVITDHWINICFWFGVNIFLLVYRYIYVYTLCDTGMYTSDLDQWAWSILFLYIYTHQQNSNVHYWLLWWALSIDIYTSTGKSVLFICLFVIYIFWTIL